MAKKVMISLEDVKEFYEYLVDSERKSKYIIEHIEELYEDWKEYHKKEKEPEPVKPMYLHILLKDQYFDNMDEQVIQKYFVDEPMTVMTANDEENDVDILFDGLINDDMIELDGSMSKHDGSFLTGGLLKEDMEMLFSVEYEKTTRRFKGKLRKDYGGEDRRWISWAYYPTEVVEISLEEFEKTKGENVAEVE